MTLQLAKPILADFIFICQRLREDERQQFEAFGSGDPYDAEEAAIGLASTLGPKWSLVEENGTPVVVGGFTMIRPGCWQDWLIGTPEGWEKHWRSITKNCRRVMDKMLATEAHRLQCVALASRIQARQWYRVLRYEYEGTLRNYGAHGEDAVIYARTNGSIAEAD